MARRDVIVVGASAGGVEALRALVAGLPADLPAAVLVVLHLPAMSHSALPMILARSGRLPVKQAAADDAILPGHVLVAAPDHHLIVYGGKVTLSRGPRENGHRPAVDVLFRSAARALGARTIGVVLSGALDDGAAGLLALRRQGGVGVVQDPEEALHASMPQCAIDGAAPEHVVPLAEMPQLLRSLVEEDVDATSSPPPSELLKMEIAMARLEGEALNDPDRPGEPSGLSCPECNGTLFSIHEGDLMRFRCRVGHAWSAESLVAQQSSAMESALWMALRGLEEKAALTRDMSVRAAGRGHAKTAASLEAECDEALSAALLLRNLITRAVSGSVDLSDERAGAHG